VSSPSDEAPATDSHAETARDSTRGVAVIAFAKVWFLLTGFPQQVLLLWILRPVAYGVYGSVLNVISIVNNVVVTASIQGMSRAVTESGNAALRRGLQLHVMFGVFASGSLMLLATPIGLGILGDPQLPGLLRIAAIVVGLYAVYAALVGALNGARRFRAQAGLDILFATLRTGLILGLAATPFAVRGAVSGFAAASVVITLTAAVVVFRTPLAEHPPPGDSSATPSRTFGEFARHYTRFFAPVVVYQFALNLVLQSDLLVLKALLVRRAGASIHAVNQLVGMYKSVQNFAFLPYQLLLAVTFVAFPVVSRATLAGDREATRRFVAGTARFSLLALGAMLAVLAGMPFRVLRLAYPPGVAEGANVLRILSIGQGFFALAVIGTTIIVASGRIALATVIMVGTFACTFGGNVLGVFLGHSGVHALEGAASGTAAGSFAAFVVVSITCARTFGAFVTPATLARAVIAAGVSAIPLSFVGTRGKLLTLALAPTAVALYIVALVALREIGAAERTAIAGLLRRRRRR